MFYFILYFRKKKYLKTLIPSGFYKMIPTLFDFQSDIISFRYRHYLMRKENYLISF